MPELPEVETIVRDLRKLLVCKKIVNVKFATPSVWRRNLPKESELKGAFIEKIDREGKNILIYLSDDRALIAHLKMTGRLIYCEDKPSNFPKHTHFVMRLDKGWLYFNDIRRFGYLDLIKLSEIDHVDYLSRLGPDPFEVSRQDFVDIVMSKRRMLKPLLMDQTVISGLGNLYSDEALFEARAHPKAISSSLSAKKAGELYDAIIKILEQAIRSKGSSIANYVDGKGKKGRFQYSHKVYGQQGEPCSRCGYPIERIKLSGRSCYFCPSCQK